MSYQVGQAVVYDTPYEKSQVGFVLRTYNDGRVIVSDLDGDEINHECTDNIAWVSRPATEAEILEQAVKHGWKQTNSKWLYTSPSGQLELMDNDGWTPLIKRQPLSDQFGFFGQECITAHRLITALNLAK